MTGRRPAVLGAVLVAGLLSTASALAYWTAAGAGAGTAATGTLSAPGDVSASQPGSPGTVRVAWTASTAPTGGPVSGYYVRRFAGSTASAACGTSASAFTTSATCDDTGVAPGTYTYRVVAVYRTWTAESPASAALTVAGDAVAPAVSGIVRADSPATQTGNGALRWTVTFSEAVTGVDATDFVLAASGLGGSPAVTGVSGSGATYTVTASTGNGSGSLGLNLVDDDSIADAAGNRLGGSGTGTTVTGETYTLNRTIAEVMLQDGSGTAGVLGQGDLVTVRFSRAMRASTFCAAWLDTPLGLVDLSGNGQVTVTVTDGGSGTDTLTVASTGCLTGFKLGTIDLGSKAYVSGTRTFGGSGANRSTISWDPAAYTLTIQLGRASGSVNTTPVTSAEPVYTAHTAIRDSSGGAISNSPFALPPGTYF